MFKFGVAKSIDGKVMNEVEMNGGRGKGVGCGMINR